MVVWLIGRDSWNLGIKIHVHNGGQKGSKAPSKERFSLNAVILNVWCVLDETSPGSRLIHSTDPRDVDAEVREIMLSTIKMI